jgi:hypothetical protein
MKLCASIITTFWIRLRSKILNDQIIGVIGVLDARNGNVADL